MKIWRSIFQTKYKVLPDGTIRPIHSKISCKYDILRKEN